jgi:hypothetical protein
MRRGEELKKYGVRRRKGKSFTIHDSLILVIPNLRH